MMTPNDSATTLVSCERSELFWSRSPWTERDREISRSPGSPGIVSSSPDGRW